MDGDQQSAPEGGSWQFRPENAVATAPQPEVLNPRSVATPPSGSGGTITWTASEFVAHQKSGSWYALLAGGAVLLAVIIWLFTRDFISAGFILIAGAAFGVFAARQPRELTYQLDDHGLSIGPKHFSYADFRSFSVMREGAFASIVFTPLKRFGTLVTIYYDPGDEEKIIAMVSDRLPHEERKPDPLDSLMWRIRF